MERVELLLKFTLAPGLGPVSIRRILAHFGSSDRALGCTEAEMEGVPDLDRRQAKAAVAARLVDTSRELDLAIKHNITFVAQGDPSYPSALFHIHDAPPLLYVRGRILPEDHTAFGIVGTRHSSRYGNA